MSAASGLVSSIRHEDGTLDLYDYALASNLWVETVTHLHEQSPAPVSGKTTRDITINNSRGEILEEKTEAYIEGIWYTVARETMAYNPQGKRITSEDLAGQVTTTAWDCCRKVSDVKTNRNNRPRQSDVAQAGVQAGMSYCINPTVSISSDPSEAPVNQSARLYLDQFLCTDFGKILRDRLDMEIPSVVTSLAQRRNGAVDFRRGYGMPREETFLLKWIADFLQHRNTLVLIEHLMPLDLHMQKADYFHCSCAGMDYNPTVSVLSPLSAPEWIADVERDAEDAYGLVAAALSDVRLDKPFNGRLISTEELSSLMDHLSFGIIGICDGEGWCFWPAKSELRMLRR